MRQCCGVGSCVGDPHSRVQCMVHMMYMSVCICMSPWSEVLHQRSAALIGSSVIMRLLLPPLRRVMMDICRAYMKSDERLCVVWCSTLDQLLLLQVPVKTAGMKHAIE